MIYQQIAKSDSKMPKSYKEKESLNEGVKLKQVK